MSENLCKSSYSERAFVVSGSGTLKYKEQLKALGGRWNRNLKDKEGNKFQGWIFSKRQHEVSVNRFLEGMKEGNEKDTKIIRQDEEMVEKMLKKDDIETQEDMDEETRKNYDGENGEETDEEEETHRVSMHEFTLLVLMLGCFLLGFSSAVKLTECKF